MVLSNQKAVNRAAIYFFYDKDGVVDDYNLYLLNDMKKNVQQIFVVCNGKLTPEGRKKFESIGCRILVRDNVGFDVWAYKEAMEAFGWDQIKQLDELILLNFTIFGPIRPFKEMFDDMDQRDLDFWGITVHHGATFDPWKKIKFGFLPIHLQSHFIAVRKTMLNSVEFRQYWDQMRPVECYEDAVCYHEAIFTKTFADKGFKWNAYVDTTPCGDKFYYPLMMMPLELLKNYRCPILKRKNFFLDAEVYLRESGNEAGVALMDYLKKNTDYDVDLIWQNLLRTQNSFDLKNCLGFDFILPGDKVAKPQVKSTARIALIVHIYELDMTSYILEYVRYMPEDIDVYVTTDTKEKQAEIYRAFQQLPCNHLEVRLVPNRGRDLGPLLTGVRDVISKYDYICKVHDKKALNVRPATLGQSFSYQCFECLLHSKEYVQNVINTFDENPRVGMLMPPPPHYGDYYPIVGREWTINEKVTAGLAKKMGLQVDITPDKPPIAPLGSFFWFRAKALEKLFAIEWKPEDFPEEPLKEDGTILHGIERLFPFVVQDAGYYPAWVMPDTYASVFVNNLYFYLRSLNTYLFHGEFCRFSDLLDRAGRGKEEGEPEQKSSRVVMFFKFILPPFIYRAIRYCGHLAMHQPTDS